MFGYRRNFYSDPFFKTFRHVGRLFGEMDRYLGQAQDNSLHAGSGFPLVDVWTSQEGAIVIAEIPGVATEDLDVSVLADTLTIRGKREQPVLDEGEDYVRQERFTGEFVRAVQLPFRVNPDQVEASHHNGVLTIKLTRPAEDLPRRITVPKAS